jgi:hypothetical protein
MCLSLLPTKPFFVKNKSSLKKSLPATIVWHKRKYLNIPTTSSIPKNARASNRQSDESTVYQYLS